MNPATRIRQIWGAEFLGTCWVTFAGCGAVLLAASHPASIVGFLSVALAFGLAVAIGVAVLGPVSGAHFNPAVSLGLAVAGRLRPGLFCGYVLSQVCGACAAAGLLYLIASGRPDAAWSGVAANGFGDHSPGGYGLLAAAICEAAATFILVVVVLASTADRGAERLAGMSIGLCVTLVHLAAIPVTGASVNPARSTGAALLAPDWALFQLWLFWAAPLAGALLGGLAYRFMPTVRLEEPQGRWPRFYDSAFPAEIQEEAARDGLR